MSTLPSIAVIVDWPRPTSTACQEQTMATLSALSRLGHEITLHMPRGAKDPALDRDALNAHFGTDGVFDVVQHRTRWGGSFVVNTWFWVRQSLASAEVRRADVVYSRIPIMLFNGWRSPLPFLLDHYRPWPDMVPVFQRAIARTLNARNCLGLALHSAFAAKSYAGLAGDPGKLLVAMNGHEAHRFAKRIDRDEARRELGLPADAKIVLYAGRTNRKKGLDKVIELADLCPRAHFALVGHEGQEWIAGEAERRENVSLFDWQRPRNLPPWLAAADVLLIPPSLAPLQKYGNCVLPLKTFQYLAAGRPVLAPRSPDTAGLLEHDENAFLVAPDDPAAAATALDQLLADGDLATRLGENARRTAAGLTWDARAEKLSAFIAKRLEALSRAN